MTPAASGKRTALVLAAICTLVLLGAEGAYRVRVAQKIAAWDRPLSYRLTPAVYVEYDERHGERLKPGSELWITYVEDGRVAWGSVVSRSNQDGLGGRTTLAEYARARVKVLVFGDSFTHWNQGSVTWPDLLEENLKRVLGRDVALLNYGRGTYGVLQMLDLAADVAAERRPDLIVLAPIGNDFTRGRWWCKEVRRDGLTRWMLSSRKDEFLDYRFAVDEMLVDPAATPEWCRRRLAAGGSADPVLASANAQFVRIRNEVQTVRRDFHPFSPFRSYLWRRLTRGHPFAAAPLLIPQFDAGDLAADERTVDNVRRLKALGIPLLLVYLPTSLEMERHEWLLDGHTLGLVRSLERLTGRRFHQVQREYTGKVPAKIDLLPIDAHPNREGLQLFADAVTPMALAELTTARGAQPTASGSPAAATRPRTER